MERASALFQRVLMLVRCPFPLERRPPLWWMAILMIVWIPLIFGAASLSVRRVAHADAPLSTPMVNTFPMAYLVLQPSPPGTHRRAPLFELPIRLPKKFDLTVEVWGDQKTLSETRVVGLLLRGSRVAADDEAQPASWHVIRVRCDQTAVSLWVDGQPNPLEREAHTLTSWLSVEPAPNVEGRFQRLLLSW